LELHPQAEPLAVTHQGPFVFVGDGKILTIDAAKSHTSQDGGKTWMSQPLAARPEGSEQDVVISSERALVHTRGGVVVAGFMDNSQQRWTWDDRLGDAPGAVLPTYTMRSLDGGSTWQDVQKLHDDWTGAVRGLIETSDGLLVLSSMKMLHAPGRHAVQTYWSADQGKTWHAGNLIDLGGAGHHGGVTEATLVELRDKRVWSLLRTNWMEFWSGYSFDGGKNWRILQPSGIPASSAPAMLARLTSGRIVLVWNLPYPEGKDSFPLSGGDGLWSEVSVSNHRGELVMAFSSDEGKSWSRATVLARQPGASLAYPFVFEAEPGVLWITTMQGDVRLRVREKDFVVDGS
jgi:hypothetical protein